MSEVLMESLRILPAPRLRPFVAWYAGYRQAGLPAGHHRGLPSPFLTMIVTLDDPLVVSSLLPGQAPQRYDTLLGGLHTSPALITHDGRQSGIQLALHPLGARALLGCPAGGLAGFDVPADAVLGPAATRIREQVLSGRTWPERFGALDRALCRLLDRNAAAPAPAAVGRAWLRLVGTGGQVAIEQLADEIGWSGRQLRKQMSAETGLTPKAAGRVIRFDRARRLLAARVAGGLGTDLAGLAAASGYYDQAHLAREFNEMAGCPPSRWVVEEFRNIQAGAHHEPPDWSP